MSFLILSEILFIPCLNFFLKSNDLYTVRKPDFRAFIKYTIVKKKASAKKITKYCQNLLNTLSIIRKNEQNVHPNSKPKDHKPY